ncbi:MAG: hypothetical protein ABI779_12460 [Acidobacteriota bacterium]
MSRFQRSVVFLLHLAVAPFLFAISPRITYERVLLSQHDLGRDSEVALIHALTDTPAIETFVTHFVEEANHAGFLHVRDARGGTGPADRYLAVKSFTCETFVREGEGSTRDIEGNRVKRKSTWAESVCLTRIDVMAADMKRLSTFYAKGEGASKHVEQLTADEREVALQQAARYAAVDAAERITPRRVREIIPLDGSAPAFEEGLALIESGRLKEARAYWESSVPKNAASAALRFNLAAVCEALGDRVSARKHYTAARTLAPKEEKYTSEMRAFERRQ